MQNQVTADNGFGHALRSKIVFLAEEESLATRQLRAPRTKEDSKSFLGIVAFVGRFIPSFAPITFPMRKIASLRKLGCIDVDKKTQQVADVSTVGLGALLLQVVEANEVRVLDCAAKDLASKVV